MATDSFNYTGSTQSWTAPSSQTILQSNWTHVALVDDGGITITGSDIQNAGGTLPVTLSRTESYKSASATTRMGHDPYTDATIETPEDTVVLTHEYHVPAP